jgi:hypothetical protein
MKVSVERLPGKKGWLLHRAGRVIVIPENQKVFPLSNENQNE